MDFKFNRDVPKLFELLLPILIRNLSIARHRYTDS